MRRPSPDRALRKLVADIGRAHPDDIVAVLRRLDPEHQGRARALLAAYVGREVPAPEPAAPRGGAAPQTQEEAWPKGLSAWLLARLDPSSVESLSLGAAGPAASRAITPTAQAALRASARALPPSRAAADALQAPSGVKRTPRWRALRRPQVSRR